MSTAPFEPKGDVARWVPIYEFLQGLGPGDFVSYSTLSDLAGVDIQYDRSAFRQAEKKLLEENQRALQVERGEGYRVMYAHEHAKKAQDKTREASRRVQSAIRILTNTDQNDLTPDQVTRNDLVLGALTGVHDMTRRLARRQEKSEAMIKSLRQKSKNTTADVAGLDDRLSRLEKLLRGTSVPKEIEQ